MRKKLMALITCLSLLAGGAQIESRQVEAATQFTGTHFAMEFNSHDEANLEKAHGWSNGGMFNCTWQDSNVNFSNDGIMNLTINSNGNGGYTGGEYRTRQTFGYGMYQVNMKPIKNPGVVTSFFTYTGPTDGTIWDEIDIEFLGYDTTKVQFNYFTNGVGEHEYLYDLGFDASLEFHTYGFYWGKGTITWYVDGKPVYTVNSDDVPVTPGKIMMNVWPGTGVDSWLKPYNGATPLTGYYDWAVYDAPRFEEETTREETTIPEVTTVETETTQKSGINNGIELNGYQISSTCKGMRTVYSVENQIENKDVVASGIIYSLSDYSEKSELYVGSQNKYVRSYESTMAGKSKTSFSSSDTATSYVMTMRFATNEALEYETKWRVRGYAKLNDGTYVYTDLYEYTIFDIADKLYQSYKMNTKSAHDYLYTDILTKVDKNYKENDFDWKNSIVL